MYEVHVHVHRYVPLSVAASAAEANRSFHSQSVIATCARRKARSWRQRQLHRPRHSANYSLKNTNNILNQDVDPTSMTKRKAEATASASIEEPPKKTRRLKVLSTSSRSEQQQAM